MLAQTIWAGMRSLCEANDTDPFEILLVPVRSGPRRVHGCSQTNRLGLRPPTKGSRRLDWLWLSVSQPINPRTVARRLINRVPGSAKNVHKLYLPHQPFTAPMTSARPPISIEMFTQTSYESCQPANLADDQTSRMERPTCHSRRRHVDEIAFTFRVVVSGCPEP